MARVKNIFRSQNKILKGTQLPRALWEKKEETPVKKQTKCLVCGLLLRSGNLSRHMRNQHLPRDPPSPEPPEVGGVLELGVSTSAPAPSSFLTPPVEEAVVPKLKLKLPAVDRALKKRNSVEREEEDLRHLPPTPETEEDKMRGLAKLYSGRVSRDVRNCALSYTETSSIAEAARDPKKREELVSILASCGYILHSREEQEDLIRAAEDRGRCQAMCSPSASSSTPRGDVPDQEPEEPVGTKTAEAQLSTPPLLCTSIFKPGEPHTVTIHTGGDWGIKISTCEISKF